MESEKRKTSITTLVQSTIGLGLVTPAPGGKFEHEVVDRADFSRHHHADVLAMETQTARLHFNSKSSAGSVSSDKVAGRTNVKKQDSSPNIGLSQQGIQPSLEG